MIDRKMQVPVLFEDENVIVIWKPAGLDSQSSRGFGADVVSELRHYIFCGNDGGNNVHRLPTKISTTSTKPPEPYIGVIHRLDKPVSGIMVYAKTPKAAAALSRQVADGGMEKTYLAVVCGKVPCFGDNYVDYLLKDEKENRSRIVDKGTSGAKRAALSWKLLEQKENALALLEITLGTGRHHQIRVQLSGHGLPIWGDQKYNPQFAGRKETIALSAWKLAFTHPVTGRRMEFSRLPQNEIFHIFKTVDGNAAMHNLTADGAK